jgi:hypothetical protein
MKLHELKWYWNDDEVMEAFKARGRLFDAVWRCALDEAKQNELIAWTKWELFARSRRRYAAMCRFFESMGDEFNPETGEWYTVKVTKKAALWDARVGDHTALYKLHGLDPPPPPPKFRRKPRVRPRMVSFLDEAVKDVFWIRRLWKNFLGHKNRLQDDPDRIKAEYIAADFWGVDVEAILRETQ